MSDIGKLFERAGWVCTMPETGLWQSSFFTDREEEYDLYVMEVDDWVHFAVTPLLPPLPNSQAPRLHAALLTLNQQMRNAHFALDSEGDVTLVADIAQRQLDDAAFSAILDALVFYTERLTGELWRIATDPTYHSPLIKG